MQHFNNKSSCLYKYSSITFIQKKVNTFLLSFFAKNAKNALSEKNKSYMFKNTKFRVQFAKKRNKFIKKLKLRYAFFIKKRLKRKKLKKLKYKKFTIFFKVRKWIKLYKFKKRSLFSYKLWFKKALRISYGFMRNKKLIQLRKKAFATTSKYKINGFVSLLERTLLHVIPKFQWFRNARISKALIHLKLIRLNEKRYIKFPYFVICSGDLLSIHLFAYMATRASFFALAKEKFVRWFSFNVPVYFLWRVRNLNLVCLFEKFYLNRLRFSEMFSWAKVSLFIQLI